MNEVTGKDSSGVQSLLAELEAEMVGVARIEDIEGTGVAKAALELLPSCRSIVVLGAEIYAEFLDLTTPERTAGAPRMNSLLKRHVDYVQARLSRDVHAIARASHDAGLKALPIPGEGPPVDGRFPEAVISCREAAEYAGLGQTGMSGLLVTRAYGPRLQLAVCLTEAELESTASDDTKACRYCNVCVFKCPARAIGYPKLDEGEKCAIDESACHQYIFDTGGCSECMRVCPVASPKYNQ